MQSGKLKKTVRHHEGWRVASFQLHPIHQARFQPTTLSLFIYCRHVQNARLSLKLAFHLLKTLLQASLLGDSLLLRVDYLALLVGIAFERLFPSQRVPVLPRLTHRIVRLETNIRSCR